MHNGFLRRITAASLLLFVSAFVQAGVVVVVGASSSVQALSADQAKHIYLGKTSTFPDGQEAIPIEQPEGAPARHLFHSKVTGKDPSQLNAYWSKLMFTGKGQPPRQIDPDKVRGLLAANPNLIGYLDREHADSSVRILLEL